LTPSSWFSAHGDSSVQILTEDGERIFCRAWRRSADSGRDPVLAVLPASERPSPGSLDRLSHEYGLRDELDSVWAVRPLELGRDHGRPVLLI